MVACNNGCMTRFTLPTLVTLTAPTCAGKNHLLEALIERRGFTRIVGTTDRPRRDGEVEGLHYRFLTTAESLRAEAAGELAELVVYNGVRYGVTHAEMAAKLSDGTPPIVILEPSGLTQYQAYCRERGWQLFSIYIETPEAVRLERLVERTTHDIQTVLARLSDGQLGLELARREVKALVSANNRRLKAVIEQERSWSNATRWDAIVSGTDTAAALSSVEHAVRYRNSRTDIYR